jgi:hypothetical protein
MRTSTIFPIVLAALALSRSAWAFEPISPDEAAKLSGKTVYVAANERVYEQRTATWVFAGTAVTVSSVAQAGTDPAFWGVLGTTRDGRAIRLPLYRVSKAAPTFDLNAPSASLFGSVLSEAEALSSRAIAIHEKYKHAKVTDVAEAAMLFALEQTLIADAGLLKEINRRGSAEALLQDGKYKWLVDAKDSTLYDLMIGKGSKDLQQRARAASQAVDLFEYAATDCDLTSLFTQRDLMLSQFRQGLGNAPADKVAQAEKDMAARYDKQIKDRLQRSKKNYDQAVKLRATIR